MSVAPRSPGDKPVPADRVEDALSRWGEHEVVRRCASLLRLRGDDAVTGDELELAMLLGGRRDPAWLAGGRAPGHGYWARVWAARALLYAWGDHAVEAVIGALEDDQWRVREMASKVIRSHELASAADRLAVVAGDPVPRVRIAIVRALAVVGEGEHAEVVRPLLADPDPRVARAAAHALADLSRRLDRPF